MTNTIRRIEPPRDRGGEWVRMGDAEYKIPPLNFRQIKKFLPQLSSMSQLSLATLDTSRIDAITELIHEALKRNYPDITADEVDELVDLGNMLQVFTHVMQVSGMIQPKDDGAPESGETTTPSP